MNIRKSKWLIILLVFFMFGCVSSQQNYSDPLAEIGDEFRGKDTADFSNVKLGIVFSENSRKAIELVTENQKTIKSIPLTNTTALEDADASFLTNKINAVLKERFGAVIAINDPKLRQNAGVDAVMLMDIQIQLGWMSGTKTHVALKGIFLDDDASLIGEVKGEGEATVPYPASSGMFKPAAADAVRNLAASLDRSDDIAAVIKAKTPLIDVVLPASPSKKTSTPSIMDGKRIALVIGNSDYLVGDLPNPVNDAALMAKTLERVGFDVQVIFNASQRDLKRSIIKFGDLLDNAGPDAVGLFYYAGHGIQVNGKNYLIPVDAIISREKDIIVEAVTAETVLEAMDFARNQLNFVILDACRNNPFSRTFRSSARGLARMQAPRGTLISYSTAPGAVAADGEGVNSPYTEALATNIPYKGVPVEHVFKRTRVAVLNATNGAQTPWESSSLTGDFYFVPEN